MPPRGGEIADYERLLFKIGITHPVETSTSSPAKLTKALLSERFVCIHGHFYQPPRENPWLNMIDEQPSAAPCHDWNERVTQECYGPNAAARIVNAEGEIIDIRNNYEKISFNMGPTLLDWMEHKAPEAYKEILVADARSVETRNGHGNALAQVYNHLIMPLATRRDKETQIIWGIEDFRRRFRRDPEGMWLAETAVDTETLEMLAANGIKYTILAPRQAKAWRDLEGTSGWKQADKHGIDPSRAYVCTLPSKQTIVLFFYDGPISQAVAFEGLLMNGDRFANRLLMGFNGTRKWPQLMHIGTDGESYGHHHRFGEMALAYALHIIEAKGLARLTNYGEYLTLVTPTAEAQIWENSSWSCVHGVERWQSNCGCNSGMHGDWHQKWRKPLRNAYDVLKVEADRVFVAAGAEILKDPWAARNDYIHVLSNQGMDSAPLFMEKHLIDPKDPKAQSEAMRLMEVQRNSMLMYTSCAWFFDEISGIETIQTMRYAARLLQLIRHHSPDLENIFVNALSLAPSNVHHFENGADVWFKVVKPQVVDLRRAVANYSIMNYDRFYEGTRPHYCFQITEHDSKLSSYGECRLKISRISALAPFTGSRLEATVCVLHLSGHDFQCRIGSPMDDADYEMLHLDLFRIFSKRSLAEVVRAIDFRFGGRDYTISDLFDDCRRDLLERVTSTSVARFDSMLRLMFNENRKLMEYMRESGAPLPRGFLAVAEYVLRARLKVELEKFFHAPETSQAVMIAADAAELGVHVANTEIEGLLAHAVEHVFHELAITPTGAVCRTAEQLLDIMDMHVVPLDLWEAQNIVFALVTGRPLPAHLAAQSRHTHRQQQGPIFPALRQLANRLKVSGQPLETAYPHAPSPEREQAAAPQTQG